MNSNQEDIKLLNTAIIKTKEKTINPNYEKRLDKVCGSPAMKILSHAIIKLADSQNITRDQAAINLVETIRELDSVWNDYLLMEGIGNIKGKLNNVYS